MSEMTFRRRRYDGLPGHLRYEGRDPYRWYQGRRWYEAFIGESAKRAKAEGALREIAKANDSYPGSELAEIASAALESREQKAVGGSAI